MLDLEHLLDQLVPKPARESRIARWVTALDPGGEGFELEKKMRGGGAGDLGKSARTPDLVMMISNVVVMMMMMMIDIVRVVI